MAARSNAEAGADDALIGRPAAPWRATLERDAFVAPFMLDPRTVHEIDGLALAAAPEFEAIRRCARHAPGLRGWFRDASHTVRVEHESDWRSGSACSVQPRDRAWQKHVHREELDGRLEARDSRLCLTTASRRA